MSARAVGAGVLALGLAACAPSPARFAADRQYGEAVCAASVFSEDPIDRDAVLRAIDAEVKPAINVHAVTRAELAASVGEIGERLADGVIFLRVVQSYTVAPTVKASLDVGLDAGAVELPVDRPALAALTEEPLPHTTRTTTRAGVLDKIGGSLSGGVGGLAAGMGELLFLGTIPFTEIFGYAPSPVTVEHSPTDDEYLRSAPAAETLYRSMRPRDGEWSKVRFMAWTRPRGPYVHLAVVWKYSSYSYRGPCDLEGRASVRLPPGATLEERINSLFGSKLRRVSDLPR